MSWKLDHTNLDNISHKYTLFRINPTNSAVLKLKICTCQLFRSQPKLRRFSRNFFSNGKVFLSCLKYEPIWRLVHYQKQLTVNCLNFTATCGSISSVPQFTFIFPFNKNWVKGSAPKEKFIGPVQVSGG